MNNLVHRLQEHDQQLESLNKIVEETRRIANETNSLKKQHKTFIWIIIFLFFFFLFLFIIVTLI